MFYDFNEAYTVHLRLCVIFSWMLIFSLQDGLVFRISIALPRELHLLQTSTSIIHESLKPTPPSEVDSDEEPEQRKRGPAVATPASISWMHLNQTLPVIAGTLSGAMRSHSHVLPVACRLAKRWLSAHGYPVIMCPFDAEHDAWGRVQHKCVTLRATKSQRTVSRTKFTDAHPDRAGGGGRLTEIAVELLVLYAAGISHATEQQQQCSSSSVWLNPCGSPVMAFLRFLRLLVTHDWAKQPLLIDLNDGFTGASVMRGKSF